MTEIKTEGRRNPEHQEKTKDVTLASERNVEKEERERKKKNREVEQGEGKTHF